MEIHCAGMFASVLGASERFVRLLDQTDTFSVRQKKKLKTIEGKEVSWCSSKFQKTLLYSRRIFQSVIHNGGIDWTEIDFQAIASLVSQYVIYKEKVLSKIEK